MRLGQAEVLDKDGNFYPDTLRQAKSIDTFICNVNGHYYLYETRSETAFIGRHLTLHDPNTFRKELRLYLSLDSPILFCP